MRAAGETSEACRRGWLRSGARVTEALPRPGGSRAAQARQVLGAFPGRAVAEDTLYLAAASSSDIPWRTTKPAVSWRSWNAPATRPSISSPTPSASCAAASAAPASAATCRTSRHRLP